jgi:hypothetical protein
MSEINYTHEYGSQLPNTPMSLHHFLDATDAISSLINEVKELQAQGLYAEAANVITANNLKRYMLTSEYINLIDEETRNLEIMCKTNQQSIYYMNNEPAFALISDVWIGE